MSSRIVDVAIGLAFAFLFVSVLVSAVQEFVAGLLGSRSRQLERGIKCLLSGETHPKDARMRQFIADLFAHPLVFNFSPGQKLPSYLPAANFSQGVLDVARQHLQASGRAICNARDLIEAANAGPWGAMLAPLIRQAQGDVGLFRRLLEEQYDQMMDRVAGWYKRRTQWFMLLYGLLIAAALNVDAGQLARDLWRDPVARATAVAAVAAGANTASPGESPGDVAAREAVLALKPQDQLPIGWPTAWAAAAMSETPAAPVPGHGSVVAPQVSAKAIVLGVFLSLCGWFLTALAASLGAPFWFDAVGKLVQLRNAGNKPPRAADARARGPHAISETGAGNADGAAEALAQERNAIVGLHAALNRNDPSYRPLQSGETW